jgi:hypothetical protein
MSPAHLDDMEQGAASHAAPDGNELFPAPPSFPEPRRPAAACSLEHC